MLELFGTAASRTSRVLWALEEMGLDYVHHPLHHKRGETKSEAFLSISPAARIPILRSGDDIVRQSMAINLYLASEFGPNALMPIEPATRAACYEWTLWAATEVEPHSFFRLVEGEKPAQDRDVRAIERADASLASALGYLETMLGDRDYLTGDRFVLADLNTVGPLEYCQRSGFDLAPWPAVSVWLERCQSREAYLRVVAMKAAA